MTATLGSLFDGIGGFPLAAVMNGIKPLWASEIEPFPIKVTKIRFPAMRHVGDITRLRGEDLPPVDILTGGSPCQDVSSANCHREGLAGKRSGLFMEQIRITKELRYADLRRKRPAHLLRPRWVVWENVPGFYNSGPPGAKYEDFRTVLEEFCRVADGTVSVPRPPRGVWEPAGCILGEEFSVAWRVLDAQYWPQTPQRRRRIYLVADFGGHTAPQILFEQSCLFGDPAPGQGAGQGPADTTEGSAGTPGGNPLTAFACNQRDKVRDLRDTAAAVCASQQVKQGTLLAATGCLTPWDTQQQRISTGDGIAPTLAGADGGGGRNPAGLLFSAGFSAGAGAKARSLGYQDECAPTLKGGSGGNMVPAVHCLNDQGGNRMDISQDVTGTLRAGMAGHPPIVAGDLYENHGIDARVKGPLDVAPTISAAYGTGGNNTSLVQQAADYCIAGNIIDRQPKNGGNGLGVNEDVAYTLTATDHHAVYSRQRLDQFRENEVTSTQSARQFKDATDLVCDAGTYQDTADTLCNSDHRGVNNQYVSGDNCIVETPNLVRRITVLEAERLQGYPDGWTDIPGASDTARYKALGNSIAIPCAAYVLRGIMWLHNKLSPDHPPE